MNAMAPTRVAVRQRRRVLLAARPAAPAEARSQVLAAICTWHVPVDPAVAVLLTSELVTNAVKHGAGDTVLLDINCSGGQFRVDVHDSSCFLPVQVDAPAEAEAGRGLMLVTSLSEEWGTYRIPAGKAVYFTLAFQHGPGEGPEREPQGGVQAWVR
jgi:anti-sigma regulatory factor (Ser/Thr protein kinase)